MRVAARSPLEDPPQQTDLFRLALQRCSGTLLYVLPQLRVCNASHFSPDGHDFFAAKADHITAANPTISQRQQRAWGFTITGDRSNRKLIAAGTSLLV
jgi:hypothetical protein